MKTILTSLYYRPSSVLGIHVLSKGKYIYLTPNIPKVSSMAASVQSKYKNKQTKVVLMSSAQNYKITSKSFISGVDETPEGVH